MKLVYKAVAINDIKNVVDYIEGELKNPIAASNLKESIAKGISRLKSNPKLGKVLKNSNYRYIIINNILVFYEIDNDIIYITRVLDGRTDYLKLLF